MADRADGFGHDTRELALCAQINFQNFEQVVPAIRSHPMWRIAMDQFNAVVGRLERAEVYLSSLDVDVGEHELRTLGVEVGG